MPTLSDLLADPSAVIEIVVRGEYLDETDTLQVIWLSRGGWADDPNGPAGRYCLPLIDFSIRVSQEISPLEPSILLDTTFAHIELINDSIFYSGYFDEWWRYTVDGLEWKIYLVGFLSDKTRVELSDVELDPLHRLVGISIPEIGSSSCVIRARAFAQVLNLALQPVTYSPPALYFPGTLTAIVNLGNNLNITGTQSISIWVYLEDPASTLQYIEFKDSGSAGHYIAVGLVGGGTIAAGVEVLVRGQSPTTTTTAANVLQAYRWHRIDVSIAALTRRIDIDGAVAITTSAITGTPTASSVDLEIGRSLRGRLHRLLHWTDARNNATMSAEGRTPIAGTETNLREALLFGEGSGNQVASTKSGSSLVGTLADGVLWDTASWHYESILGQHEPYVLGTVPRVPVTWLDPPKQIGQVSRGAIALLSELQSNHTAVNSANYTVDTATGTLKVTSGALSGTYSATVTANNLWKSAVLFNGTSSGGTVSATMPAGSKYLGAHFRVDTTSTATRIIVQWPATTGHRMTLRLNGTGTLSGTNILRAQVVNDTNVEFTASIAVQAGMRYSAVATLDVPNLLLKLYVNGALAATTAVTGAYTGTFATLSVGHNSVAGTGYFPGVIDEVIFGNVVCTPAMAQLYHTIPSTAGFTGIQYGFHLDEGTGSTGAPFVGANSITFANITWMAGRSAPTDLARVVLYSKGYTENDDLDPDSWYDALVDCPCDCGWFVANGAKAIDVLNVILGGLGFILYESGGLLKIKRFEGLSGTPDVELDPAIDLQSQPVDGNASDPAVYQWTVNFATNNSKQDIANVAGGLATTDPDRYQYGAAAHRSAPKSDGSILERFPSAVPMVRTTALLNLRDAEAEAARLLAIHRHGADRKSISAFVGIAQIETLDELGPLMEETDLDASDLIVTGLTIDEGLATLSVWRPAIP